MMLVAVDIIEDLLWQAPPRDPSEILWIWLGVSAVVLLMGIAIFFLARRQKAISLAEAQRVIPAHIAALESLQRAKLLLAEESAREFVVVVSRVLRDYIQHRFDIRASHQASEEFLWQASNGGLLTQDDEVLLGKFLSRCDRVKFAKGRVTHVQMNELFDSSHRFIVGTIPSPPPEPEEAAKN